MDWALAIDINRKALLRILAVVVAMLDAGETVPRNVHRTILAILRPAEAIARRLIAVAAVGVAVPARKTRAAPVGAIPSGSDERVPVFRLFDPRRKIRESAKRSAGNEAGVWSFDGTRPRTPEPPIATPDDPVSAKRVSRRLRAVIHALDTIPAQARRLARVMAAMERPIRVMRPGRPPGFRARGRHEIDVLLAEVHALALMALAEAPP